MREALDWGGASGTEGGWLCARDNVLQGVEVSGENKMAKRVGLLVKQGSLYVYVNGRQLGTGPMVSGGFPPRVRFAADVNRSVEVRVMKEVRCPE